MRKLHSVLRILSSSIVLALAAGTGAQAKTWQPFDVAGSTAVVPTALVYPNTIIGYYTDADGHYSSFSLASGGPLITFNLTDGGQTIALCGSGGGDIAGTATGTNKITQAFLRPVGGQLTLFSINGSSFTEATGMNANDVIAGDYLDPSTSKQLGFVRRLNGKIQTFSSPDGTDIAVKAINNDQTVVGTYGTHGFSRNAQGQMTTLRLSGTFVAPVAINSSGAIAGTYGDSAGKVHGFIAANGSAHGFNPPHYAGNVTVTGFNDAGILIGYNRDSQNKLHSFALNAAGTFASLDAPKGTNGTVLTALGGDGKMVGYYYDANNTSHAVRVNASATGF